MGTKKGVIRAGKGSNIDYMGQNFKSKFNSVYSRDNLPRRKDETYVINLNEK